QDAVRRNRRIPCTIRPIPFQAYFLVVAGDGLYPATAENAARLGHERLVIQGIECRLFVDAPAKANTRCKVAGIFGVLTVGTLAYRRETPGKRKPQSVLEEAELILQINPFILLRHRTAGQCRTRLQAGGTIKRWEAVHRHA